MRLVLRTGLGQVLKGNLYVCTTHERWENYTQNLRAFKAGHMNLVDEAVNFWRVGKTHKRALWSPSSVKLGRWWRRIKAWQLFWPTLREFMLNYRSWLWGRTVAEGRWSWTGTEEPFLDGIQGREAHPRWAPGLGPLCRHVWNCNGEDATSTAHWLLGCEVESSCFQQPISEFIEPFSKHVLNEGLNMTVAQMFVFTLELLMVNGRHDEWDVLHGVASVQGYPLCIMPFRGICFNDDGNPTELLFVPRNHGRVAARKFFSV